MVVRSTAPPELTGFGAGCTYTAAAGFVGADSFNYTIWDTHQSSTGLVEIDVTANAAPVVVSTSVTAPIHEPEKPYGVMLGLSVSDAENDLVNFPFENTSAAGATVHCDQSSYTPLGSTTTTEMRVPPAGPVVPWAGHDHLDRDR